MATLEELQAHLRAANAPWQAGETSMSALTVEERRRKLGVVPPPAAVVAGERAAAVAPGAAAPPSQYSWRDHGGVTPVRDQGDCGSCVSFACCAATESQALIDRNVTLDLSEADAHFCSSHGATCCGWWPGDCLTDLAGRGVVREMDFPYEAAPTGQADPNCQGTWAVQCLAVAGRDEKTTVITGQATYTSATAMKQRISTTGPAVTCFSVYDDFYNYTAGIYTRSATATFIAGHCVEVVGYDDTAQPGCWICKNSWGTGWGEQGFFRIAYGECGIDDQMWAVSGIAKLPAGTIGALEPVISLLLESRRVTGLTPQLSLLLT